MSEDRVPIEASAIWPEEADATHTGVVTHWFKREGSHVSEGETVGEIQVEKVSIDVIAPATGDLVDIVAGKGDEIGPSDTLAWIEPA